MNRDFMTKERQRNLWNQQRSFARNCFYIAAGMLLLACVLAYNLMK